ncbi:MAG: hypothetical protein ACTSVI_02930, partial [Promethearchaeota archaeon]
FITPRFVNYLFDKNLSGTTLTTAISAIPIMFMLLFLVKLKTRWLKLISLLTTILTGSLLTVAGLLLYVKTEEITLTATITITLLLISGFTSSLLDLITWIPPKIKSESKNQENTRMFYYYFGIAFSIEIPIIMNLIINNEGIFWITMGMIIISSVIEKSKYTLINLSKNIKKSIKKDIHCPKMPRTKAQAIANLFLLFFSMMLFTASIYTLHSQQSLLGMVGICLGFFLVGMKNFRKVPPSVSSAIILSLLFTWTWFNHAILTSGLFLIPCGITIGLSGGELAWNATYSFRLRKSKISLYLFFLTLIIALASGLSSQFNYILNDDPRLMSIGFIFLIIIITSSIPVALNARILERIKEISAYVSEKIRKKKSQSIKWTEITAIVMMFLVPIGLVVLYYNAQTSVNIKLKTPMYDVNGNAVQDFKLLPSSAKILLYSPSNNSLTGNENIRPGKSIRLGGYYYGFGDNFTKEDVIDWVGHNNDIAAFGFAGSLTPDDILQIRTNNKNIKIYYMAFATTLYEDQSTNFSAPEWGNTHYPYVKFNDTMREWTLKLKNGSEATGVRRSSIHSNAHLMDLGNQGWADFFAWIYENRTKKYHMDGVAIDEVMWRGYWDTKISDLRNYENIDQIINSCYSWLKRIDEKMDVEIITQAFWDDAQVYQDGVWGEISFRAGGKDGEGPYGGPVNDMQENVWYESMNWEEIVNNAYKISMENKTYIWACWYDGNSLDRLEYGIATYLMAKPNNYTKFVFQPQPGYYPRDGIVGYAVNVVKKEVEAHPEYYELQLGNALGPMHQVRVDGGSVWVREFENGIVYVNPNHSHLPGF